MRKSVVILCFFALVSAAIAVYGGLTGVEIMLGAGVAAGFLCLVFIPAFYAHDGKVDKIRRKTDALIVFEYMRDETEQIVKAQRTAARKRSVPLSFLFSICFIIIFTPFCIIAAQEGGDYKSLIVIACICILMPWLSLILAPTAAENRIRRTACKSVAGPDYILIANRYMGINDRYSLRAVEKRFLPAKDSRMAELHILYRFKGGRKMVEFSKWVQIPVPKGREEDAEELVIQ